MWLPQHRIAMVSNLFGALFPHFPNLNTIRDDRYRLVESYLQSLPTVRDLGADTLVTGRHDPIVEDEPIDACLGRLFTPSTGFTSVPWRASTQVSTCAR